MSAPTLRAALRRLESALEDRYAGPRALHLARVNGRAYRATRDDRSHGSALARWARWTARESARELIVASRDAITAALVVVREGRS